MLWPIECTSKSFHSGFFYSTRLNLLQRASLFLFNNDEPWTTHRLALLNYGVAQPFTLFFQYFTLFSIHFQYLATFWSIYWQYFTTFFSILIVLFDRFTLNIFAGTILYDLNYDHTRWLHIIFSQVSLLMKQFLRMQLCKIKRANIK